MIRRLGRVRRCDRGQAAVELALLLPVLLLLLVGMFEMGRAIQLRLTVEHATREGARLASEGDVTPAEIEARIRSVADPITLDTVVIAQIGAATTIRVARNYPMFLGNASRIIGRTGFMVRVRLVARRPTTL